MDKKDLLFYDAYEEFYTMAQKSNAFKAFCKDAFGEDFSQDGFSNIKQINMILKYIPQKDNVSILDIGCGNGKMLGYLQSKTGANIFGFDYSDTAINTARNLFPTRSDFREGVIGEIDYPDSTFDVIISMDTMYFAKDMNAFVAQIKRWLKKDGILFVGYQEGEIAPKTENANTSLLSVALKANNMNYEVTDITHQTYELLKTKRNFAIKHKTMFDEEGYSQWCDMLIAQTDYVKDSFEQFKEKMARYIYVCTK